MVFQSFLTWECRFCFVHLDEGVADYIYIPTLALPPFRPQEEIAAQMVGKGSLLLFHRKSFFCCCHNTNLQHLRGCVPPGDSNSSGTTPHAACLWDSKQTRSLRPILEVLTTVSLLWEVLGTFGSLWESLGASGRFVLGTLSNHPKACGIDLLRVPKMA